MQPDTSRLTTAERANLVAFLDGELPESESTALAAKVSRSPGIQREVQTLQKSWALLDTLPMPCASAEFTERTLSRAGGSTSLDDRLVDVASRVGQNIVRGLLYAMAGVLVFGLGFAITRWAWPDPTARLARDISIAKHYDEYRAVESFEFLKQLDELPEFHSMAD